MQWPGYPDYRSRVVSQTGSAHRSIPPRMDRPLTIIGSFVSPYVRKVLAAMNLKGLAYEVDPITPFFGNDEFERLKPPDPVTR